MADTLRPLNSNTGRRRTIVRLTPNSNTRNKPFDRQSLDRGEHPESGRPPRHFKLENSYRMKPEQDEERFESWRVEQMMLQVLQERLADVSYDYFRCQTLAKELAAEIQSRARDFRWARYKILCQVTLGQKTQQSVQVASRCLWDQAVDNYASVTYATQSVFAVAQCYGVYYE